MIADIFLRRNVFECQAGVVIVVVDILDGFLNNTLLVRQVLIVKMLNKLNLFFCDPARKILQKEEQRLALGVG